MSPLTWNDDLLIRQRVHVRLAHAHLPSVTMSKRCDQVRKAELSQSAVILQETAKKCERRRSLEEQSLSQRAIKCEANQEFTSVRPDRIRVQYTKLVIIQEVR
jgi:hypothetical protein